MVMMRLPCRTKNLNPNNKMPPHHKMPPHPGGALSAPPTSPPTCFPWTQPQRMQQTECFRRCWEVPR